MKIECIKKKLGSCNVLLESINMGGIDMELFKRIEKVNNDILNALDYIEHEGGKVELNHVKKVLATTTGVVINIDSLSFKCPNCGNIIDIKGIDIHSYSRKFNFDKRMGHLRCGECGNYIEFAFYGSLTLHTIDRGLSCGICKRKVDALFGSYFCKDCYIKSIWKDVENYRSLMNREIEKLSDVDIMDDMIKSI